MWSQSDTSRHIVFSGLAASAHYTLGRVTHRCDVVTDQAYYMYSRSSMMLHMIRVRTYTYIYRHVMYMY